MTWLSTKEAACLEGKSERTLRRNKEKYQYRLINGVGGTNGVQYEFTLESLSDTAQARYKNVLIDHTSIAKFSGKQRDNANEKAWIVVQYHQSGLSPDEFVAQFNAGNPVEDAITKSQLFRWQRKYRSGDVADLIDQRGGHNRGQSSIPDEAWDYFYALYMRQQKLKIRRCYDLTKAEYPDIPSVSAFERKVRQIPKYALLYYREGPKAFRDNLPSMERTKTDIFSNSIWFSDHHLMDVFVQSADGKRVIRPWLTVFFDARSNKVTSFVVREASPNATVIKKCFRIGVEAHGIPCEVYFDNGADYRSRDFSRDYPMSLVNQLGIGTIYATPYHGQAKTCERFFGTLSDRFSRLFDTYAGKDAKNRPECMQIPNKEILRLAPTWDEFQTSLSAYIDEYNHTPSSGRDMEGKCPEQVYCENLMEKRVIHDHDALRLLCGNSEERVVHKNGISLMNNSYYHEALLAHFGEHVIIVYDPENIDKVAVFDMENRAICTAEAKIRTPYRNTTEEDYIRAAKEKKAARAVVKRYKPVRDLDVHSIIARNQLIEKQFSESEETKMADYITPQAARNAEILKSTDKSTRTRRERKEDSVSATLLKAYEHEKASGG